MILTMFKGKRGKKILMKRETDLEGQNESKFKF
jgi:hypothetical protein